MTSKTFKFRDAAIRGVRSLIQGTVVALAAFLAALAAHGSFGSVKSDGMVFLFAETLAAGYAIVAFLQNLLEDNTSVPTVK